MVAMRILHPASLLRSSWVDEEFADEAASAAVIPALFSLDEGTVHPTGSPLSHEQLLLRGWILSPEEYRALDALVTAQGAELVISPAAYRRSQFGDGWLPLFEGLTPRTVVVPVDIAEDDLLLAAQVLGASSFVMKGASKSAKHAWQGAMYAHSFDELPRVLAGLRAELDAGEPALLLREFEHWQPGELRLWWLHDELIHASAHPQSATEPLTDGLEEFVAELAGRVRELDAVLVTTDVVRHQDGRWRLVEVGSGQVSQAQRRFAELLAGTGWQGLHVR